ncbi:4'-phosphopantetheinyl transferase family protein [Nocardia harenae]|uniref:4'-phosphopantetheinyl transferase family protein n=1 Tax=Nocardia harenae TaxID=358707 RepID=UPI000835D2DD|nr:4'-phosphopantetheinyl transferase superfamily protein [Nocardia harenae]
MTGGDVELRWCALTGTHAAADLRVLSPAEIARSTRFWSAEHAADFVRARAMLRHVLADRTGRRPDDLVFTEGKRGKPELSDRAVSFNLTHTRGLAVVAVAATGSLGVDVEAVDSGAVPVWLAPRVLTAREAAAAGTDRRRFLRYWVAKESYLKWLGSGLTIAPDTLETGLDTEGRAVVTEVEGGLRTGYLHHFDLGAGYVGAFVYDHHVPYSSPRPAEFHRTSGARG